MLLDTLVSGPLGDMIAGKGIVRAGYDSKEKGAVRVGNGPKISSFERFFDSTTSFNKLRNKKNYQNQYRFRGVYSRDNLPNKIKAEAYAINLYEFF